MPWRDLRTNAQHEEYDRRVQFAVLDALRRDAENDTHHWRLPG